MSAGGLRRAPRLFAPRAAGLILLLFMAGFLASLVTAPSVPADEPGGRVVAGRLGAALPLDGLRNVDGGSVTAESLTQGRLTVVVCYPARAPRGRWSPGGGCGWEAERDALNEEGVRWVIVTPRNEPEALKDALTGEGGPLLLHDPDQTLLSALLRGEQQAGALDADRVAALVDPQGVVRYVERQPLYADASHRLASLARRWRAGQNIYLGRCARCHGEDGRASGYPEVLPLDGIGNRMTPEEIWDATMATGVVNLDGLSAGDRAALLLYVAGL